MLLVVQIEQRVLQPRKPEDSLDPGTQETLQTNQEEIGIGITPDCTVLRPGHPS